jgi:hypothetical protein
MNHATVLKVGLGVGAVVGWFATKDLLTFDLPLDRFDVEAPTAAKAVGACIGAAAAYWALRKA